MSVFADFSGGEKPDTCPVYYPWIHEKVDDTSAALPSVTNVAVVPRKLPSLIGVILAN